MQKDTCMDRQILFSESAILNNIHKAPEDHECPLRIQMADQPDVRLGEAMEVDVIESASHRSLARVVYHNEKPLGCGARVWIETRQPCSIYDSDGTLIERTDNPKRLNRIHINKNFLKQNSKNIREQGNLSAEILKPVITCKHGSKLNLYGFRLVIEGDDGGAIMTLQYNPFDDIKLDVRVPEEGAMIFVRARAA